MNETKENSLLAKLSFITSFGDWICYFGFMYFIYKNTGSVALAASVITIKAGSWLFASLVFPFLTNRVSIKGLIFYPQIACGFLAILIIFSISRVSATNSYWLLISLLAVQSVLKEVFALSRDSYSKFLRGRGTHMTMQAQLLTSNFLAQTLGPAFAVVAVNFISIETLLELDALTFFVSALLSIGLTNNELSPEKRSILAPFTYLHKNPSLLKLFLLRTFLFWGGAGISNYLTAGQVTTQEGHNIVDSAWIYVTNALGAVLVTFILKNPNFRQGPVIGRFSNIHLAAIGACVMGLSRALFAFVPYFWVGVAIWFFSGMGMGTLSAGSMTLRSELTTNKEFPEVVGLENVLGKTTDFIVQLVCAAMLVGGWITTQFGLYVAAGLSVAMGLMYFSIPLSADESELAFAKPQTAAKA